ncbi:hypothetical protein [Dyadobacter sp. 676]|uniref:Transposase n=1 Tax=Dyadobacter sp. 676 TaxID=3088362 RepID=A0AAU8FI25_9BACT
MPSSSSSFCLDRGGLTKKKQKNQGEKKLPPTGSTHLFAYVKQSIKGLIVDLFPYPPIYSGVRGVDKKAGCGRVSRVEAFFCLDFFCYFLYQDKK